MSLRQVYDDDLDELVFVHLRERERERERDGEERGSLVRL
jgi:hypothetical protein